MHHLVHESFSLNLDMMRDDRINWFLTAVSRINPNKAQYDEDFD
jgi:hypothetical protein